MAGLLRTYASGGDPGGAGSWLLFAKQERVAAGGALSFSLKALMTLAEGRRVLAELSVGEQELAAQMDALGVEMEADAFAALLSRALDGRESVTLMVGDGAAATVTAMVTYKFSETISRRGCLELPVVATDVPPPVCELLVDVHGLPRRPVVSREEVERQKQRQKQPRALDTAVETSAAVETDAVHRGEEGGAPTASQDHRQELGDQAPKQSQQRLKRKQIPTGAVRRKAAKGARLLKR